MKTTSPASFVLNPVPTARCPRCGTEGVRLRKTSGDLYAHTKDDGSPCDYRGDPNNLPDYLEPAEGWPATPTRPEGMCPICLTGVKIRVSGGEGILGTLHKHRHEAGGWCDGSGELPLSPALSARVDWEDGPGADNASDSGTSFAFFAERTVDPRHEALAAWWHGLAQAEIDMVVAKAIEYGATDLRDIGLQILEMGGSSPYDEGNFDPAYATEVGIVFYTLGKVSRLVAAIKEGRRPSLDTWLDIGVYARMAQRVHEVGAWPGV